LSKKLIGLKVIVSSYNFLMTAKTVAASDRVAETIPGNKEKPLATDSNPKMLPTTEVISFAIAHKLHVVVLSMASCIVGDAFENRPS